MKFRNKIIIFTFIFAFILFLNNFSFASSENFIIETSKYDSSWRDFNYKDYALSHLNISEDELKEYKYIVFRYSNDSSGFCYFALSKTPFYIFNYKFSSDLPIIKMTYHNYINNFSECAFSNEYEGCHSFTSFNLYNDNRPFFSNSDIYTDNTFSTVLELSQKVDCSNFFPPPPQVKTLEEVVQESHLVAKEITQEALTAELAELVPVGVMILAAIILVSLIAYFNFWRT